MKKFFFAFFGLFFLFVVPSSMMAQTKTGKTGTCVSVSRPKPKARPRPRPTPKKPKAKPTPQAPTPQAPTPQAPTPQAPTPQAPTPQAPTPQAPTPQAPTPQAPTPQAPTPQAPTPQAPTPQAPTPQAPTPQAPTPQAPTKFFIGAGAAGTGNLWGAGGIIGATAGRFGGFLSLSRVTGKSSKTFTATCSGGCGTVVVNTTDTVIGAGGGVMVKVNQNFSILAGAIRSTVTSVTNTGYTTQGATWQPQVGVAGRTGKKIFIWAVVGPKQAAVGFGLYIN